MGRFIFTVFGLLFLATGSLSQNIVVSSLAGIDILQCGEVTFSWTGGEGKIHSLYSATDNSRTVCRSDSTIHSIVGSLLCFWCLVFSPPITSTTITSPRDIAGTDVIMTDVTLDSYTVLINRPAGTTAYFTVSDGFGDAGSTDDFTILSSILPLRTHRTGNPTSNTSPTLAPAPISVAATPGAGSTNVGGIAGGAAGGAVVLLLVGLCWWKVQRRNRTGEMQTAAASPKVLESAGTPARASVSSRVAPPIQRAHTDVGEGKFQPSVELYGHKVATPTFPVPHPQEVEGSVQELAYEQKMPTRMMVATNPTPDQIRQEVRSQVEDQGRTRTTFTPGQFQFPSYSKMVMSWELPASAQGSTSGSMASSSRERELEQRLRALETRIPSFDDTPPSYDDKS
ncbi:hypothetical protein B0H11DRAFT_1898474 [Mycena galericulata]|nr:hypothetical protein B0H11DRAFT_1898474 [Mycena galericulata]